MSLTMCTDVGAILKVGVNLCKITERPKWRLKVGKGHHVMGPRFQSGTFFSYAHVIILKTWKDLGVKVGRKVYPILIKNTLTTQLRTL